MMPPVPPQPQPQGQDARVVADTFSGLKNTVEPERLTIRELARARNVDIDDLGQIHRRRGRRQIASGSWHSLFTTAGRQTFGVVDGTLVLIQPGYGTVPVLAGIGPASLAWVEVGPTLYFSSRFNSGQIDLASLTVRPWGRVVSPSYQPSLTPGPADFWYSPVVRPDSNPDSALGPVAGKLLGAPPLASYLTYHNGRIYLAIGPMLWATELYLYNYVDKTKGFRQFEADITGLCAVEDGVYVGTTAALYFLSGAFAEHTRTLREPAGVVPGSMIQAPAEVIDPEGRRFPDLPRPTAKGMVCMTNSGIVAGLSGGSTYNLTRSQFVFPKARQAAALLRQEDGMHTYVAPLTSSGTPGDNARFGDYVSAVLVRAGTPGQPGETGQPDQRDYTPADPPPPRIIGSF